MHHEAHKGDILIQLNMLKVQVTLSCIIIGLGLFFLVGTPHNRKAQIDSAETLLAESIQQLPIYSSDSPSQLIAEIKLSYLVQLSRTGWDTVNKISMLVVSIGFISLTIHLLQCFKLKRFAKQQKSNE